jgi:hypothetical protein
MILDQKTLFLFWESGQPVSYPPVFATFSALISAIFNTPSFRGVWAFVIILLCLQVFVAYLLGKELGGKHMGLASAFFFGMGTYPWTPFLYGGMYANILGHTVMLLLLYLIAKCRLSSKKHILISGLILTLLVMSHAVSLVSFLLAFVSLNIFLIYKKEGMNIENIGGFFCVGILFALPWLIHIYPSLALKVPIPHEVVLGPTEGIRMIYYRFGLLPLFSLIALYPLIKKKSSCIVFLLWALFLFLLSMSFWGNRFGMELYLPLDFLAACGFVFLSEKSYYLLKKKNPVSIIFLSFIFYFLLFSTDNLLYQPSRFTTFEVDEYNYKALKWIKNNTQEDSIFYASTVSSYVGYISVYAERKVTNYTISSSAEEQPILPIELLQIEKPENFGKEVFYDTLLKFNVTYIYLFHKGGVSEWRNIVTGESTFIVKDQLLSERPDWYEVVYENKYVKIYRIKKEKFYGTTMTSSYPDTL